MGVEKNACLCRTFKIFAFGDHPLRIWRIAPLPQGRIPFGHLPYQSSYGHQRRCRGGSLPVFHEAPFLRSPFSAPKPSRTYHGKIRHNSPLLPCFPLTQSQRKKYRSQDSSTFSPTPLSSARLSSNQYPNHPTPLTGEWRHYPRLERFTILTEETHTSTFLNHLSVPAGALLRLEFAPRGTESPLPKFLPKYPGDLWNVHPITSAYLGFCRSDVTIQPDGPSGGPCMYDMRGPWQLRGIRPSALWTMTLRRSRNWQLEHLNFRWTLITFYQFILSSMPWSTFAPPS